MQDYDPLDISRWCNIGVDVLDGESPVLGRQSLLGLPFLVGQGGGKPDDACFIDLKGGDAPVAVAVGRSAMRVVFAHRLLESQLAEGGPLGVDVAEYVFHLADGGVERAEIRERFEIAGLSGRGGLGGRAGMPYLAVPDQGAKPLPRTSGPWDMMGRRQFESEMGGAQHYYLWAWENPRPEQEIDAIEIVPKGPRFLVAGITLGNVDENPVIRTGRRPVKLVLKDADRPAVHSTLTSRWTGARTPTPSRSHGSRATGSSATRSRAGGRRPTGNPVRPTSRFPQRLPPPSP